MRDNPAAQIGLQASDQQKDTVVKSELDPLLVQYMSWPALPVVGKFKRYG